MTPECEKADEGGCGWPQLCDACKAKKVPYTLPRFTLSELHADPANMIAWLSHDGNTPTVQVQTAASRMRWGQRGSWCSKTEEMPVTDKETLEQWWKDYRAQGAQETVAERKRLGYDTILPYKQQTDSQFLAECAASLGVSGKGTVKERVARAIASRPDLYCKPGEEFAPALDTNKTPPVDVLLDPCPHCGKDIDCTALRCHHCGTDL